MRRLLPLTALLAATAMPVCGQEVFTQFWDPNTAIPDGDLTGRVFTANVSTLVVSISAVEVTLEIDTTWPGDLFAYLEYDGVASVLVNRIGRTSSNPAGTGGSTGLNITLSDSGSADVHSATPGGSGLIEGTWQPDARAVDPSLAVDTSPRSSFLADFQNFNPNGTWTLFVADADSGEVATLSRWGLRITGLVPEPGSVLLISLAATAAAFRRQRPARS